MLFIFLECTTRSLVKHLNRPFRLEVHFDAPNKEDFRLKGINSYSTEYSAFHDTHAIQDTYVPDENASGSNVYVNGNSTVTELPTPSRGTVKVMVSAKLHPESETNLRCLDKLEPTLCPTGKLAAV